MGVSWAAVSRAEPTPAVDERAFALSWVRLDGAESCPARPQLAAEVGARLGRSPFSPDAEQAIEVAVSREDGRWLVRIHARASDGTVLGSRVLESDGDDCSAVFSATVLALALTVDPDAEQRLSARTTANTPPPAPNAPLPSTGGTASSSPLPPAPTLPAAVPVQAPPSMSRPDPPDAMPPRATAAPIDVPPTRSAAASTGSLRIAMQVGPTLALGLLPGAAPGMVVRGQGTAVSGWGFDLGALLLPARRTGPDDDVADIGVGLSTGFLGASFAPLRDEVSLSFSLGGQAGAQHVAVYSPTPLEQGPGNYFWAALRGGASLGLMLVPPVGVGLAAEAVIPLTRHTYSVLGEPEPAFETRPVGLVSTLTLHVTSD